MSMNRKELGARGEDIAVDFLKKRKYKILFRNYRNQFGEIDIIAQHKKIISFVEVKTRRSDDFGLPHESIGPVKQKKISKVAMGFIQRYKLEDTDARFDVVAVKFSNNGYHVDFIENAFEVRL